MVIQETNKNNRLFSQEDITSHSRVQTLRTLKMLTTVCQLANFHNPLKHQAILDLQGFQKIPYQGLLELVDKLQFISRLNSGSNNMDFSILRCSNCSNSRCTVKWLLLEMAADLACGIRVSIKEE